MHTAAIADLLQGLSPAYAPTPLLDLPRLASRLGVAQVLAKDEGQRMLGSFKSLGGTWAGLRALARAAGLDVPALLARRPTGLPRLVCASDGNHGLAVAAASRQAGAPATVFLHRAVPQPRAMRIAAQGADIAWVNGTYDDAVDAAASAAREGAGIRVADTADDPDDPVVADVMAGYAVMAAEIRAQAAETPTHLLVQAGVGGLAAAVAHGLAPWFAAPGTLLVTEPETAPAVAHALHAGRPVRVPGDLDTGAEMLACGEASAPALAVLRRHGAHAVLVPERLLDAAPALLRACGGPQTTPSGAAGLAGALALAERGTPLPADARLLILVTEGPLPA
jgi:diaminopropionate ammonia-lyase